MTKASLGLIIGGLLPAVCFGISAVLAKFSTTAGIGVAYYTSVLGVSVFTFGVGLMIFFPEQLFTLKGAGYAFLSGFAWAGGATLVAIALSKYQAPISKLSPLFNTNSLIAVILGLLLFSEWQDTSVIKLLLGTVLIVLGGILVSNA